MEAHNENDARLVVTFFVKTRLSKSNLLAGAPSSDPFESQYQLCGATFTNLLVSLASPIPLTLLSRVILAPGVFQTIFATSAVFPDPSKLRHQASVTTFEASHGIEAVFDLVYPSSPTLGPARRPVRLAVFDMDSTLINEEVIDELARSIGITAAVSAITSRAMNGEIEFAESLRQRLALLKGVKADVWEGLKASITIAAGASELIDELRGQGVITAVVSGGFAPMAEWLKEQLSLDHAYANHVRALSIYTHAQTLMHLVRAAFGLTSYYSVSVPSSFRRTAP